MTSTTPVGTLGSSEMGGMSFSHDPEFKGPVKSRSCTDVCFLCLFIAFLAGWGVISIFAFKHGDPKTLLNPRDSYGYACGMYEYEKKPFLYFFDITKCAQSSVVVKGCKTPQVCVKSCPNETFFVDSSSPEDIKSKLICINGTDMSKPVSELISSEKCASLYLKSVSMVKRCIPTILLEKDGVVLDDSKNKMKDKNGNDIFMEGIAKATKLLAQFYNTKEFGEQLFSDFKLAWPSIFIGLVIVMLFCFLWIVLMRWIAKFMVFASLILFTAFSAFACYYASKTYVELGKKENSAEIDLKFKSYIGGFLEKRIVWIIFAIISGLIFLIMLIVLIALRKRIFIAIALIVEGSKAISSMPTSLMFPIFPFLLQFGTIAFWVAVALYIESSGKAIFVIDDALPGSSFKNGTECKPWSFTNTSARCRFESFGANMQGSQFYNLFAMLWLVFFIVCFSELSLAGAFSKYYWSRKKDMDTFAVANSVYRGLRYHLGSVAFGSLLLATLRFIRIIVEWIDHKCKKYQNPVTRAITCVMKCCFWCLEKLLKFISKNAFIMVATFGKGFLASAKMAFMLLFRNILRAVIIDKVTDFLLFIGKLTIVGAAATGAFIFFGEKVEIVKGISPELNFYMLPVLVVTICSYFISSIFFDVYQMAVSTLFLCFLEDLERNDGSAEKPYFMSKELMKILDKKNKFRETK